MTTIRQAFEHEMTHAHQARAQGDLDAAFARLDGRVERLIRTLKEQCVHRHRFENQRHAMRVLGDWIQFYNHRRPHQALGMKTPAEVYALAA